MAEADPIHQVPAIVDFAALPTVVPSRRALGTHHIVGFNSRDGRGRAFTLLRTRLAKKLSQSGQRLVGITSPTPASGKSFLSLNLAASLARVVERPVALVDLDLRRGSVAEELGISVEAGVADFLEGHAVSLQEIGQAIDGTNLTVFPTRKTMNSSAELLASHRFEALVEQFRHHEQKPLVIFDMPPVFAGDDAMLSVQNLDCYMLVVDSGRTTRRQLEEAVTMMQPTSCVGTVLNRFRGGIYDTYGYGLGSSAYDRYYPE
jgi:Mrp family chromosome partitioning ATPase